MNKTRIMWLLILLVLAMAGCRQTEKEARTIRGNLQTRPGGPSEEVDHRIETAPTELKDVSAQEAELADDALVLGIEADGVAMAYPIQFLAEFEIGNGRVGETAVAPSW